MDRIQHAISTECDIYDRIGNLKEQSILVGFISNVVETEIPSNIPTEFEKNIKDMKIEIQTNKIKERYYQPIKAFKYWIFPLECKNFQFDFNTDESMEDIKKKLSDMLNKLNANQIELLEIHDYIPELNL